MARSMWAVLAILVVGCNVSAPPATPPTPATDPGTAVPSDHPAAPNPTAGEQAPGVGETSEAAIAAALEAGSIDYPTSLVYRTYAAFGSPSLPEEYRQEAVDLHAATFVFAEIAANESLLSEEQVAALAPYMARPNDPISVFSQEPPVASLDSTIAAIPTWASKAAAGGKARVWVIQGANSAGQLDSYAAEVDKVWPKLFSLVSEPTPDTAGDPVASVNPDNAIDLYFADAGTVDPRIWSCRLNPAGEGCAVLGARGGYTRSTGPYSGTKSSGFIMIDSAVTDDLLTSHIAHELTHTAQYRYDYNESPWLLDSTATWAAFRVLQLLGTAPEPAYEYLEGFFNSLDQPLTRDEDHNRYGSWLYFLSLQVDVGDGLATKIFEKMAAAGRQSAAAVNEVYPFREHFGKFAVSNWNQETADRYDADLTFPDERQAKADYHEVLAGGESRLEVETGYLSADYVGFEFPDEIQQVVLENPMTTLIAECNCIPSVWLIAKVDGTWQKPEEVKVDRKQYCRERPGEDVEEMVVVVANPDWEGLFPLEGEMMPKVIAQETGCAGGGTVTISREKHGTYTSARDNPVTVDMSDQATITFDLVVDEFSIDSYAATTSTVTWSYSLTATEPGDGCTILERGEGGGTFTGEGGPTVALGFESDGTIFGMTLNEDAYTLSAVPPSIEMEDGDPRGFYRVWNEVCGLPPLDAWWPYSTLGIVSGMIPEGGGAFSGSRQRTLPPLTGGDNLPTIETITWSFNL